MKDMKATSHFRNVVLTTMPLCGYGILKLKWLACNLLETTSRERERERQRQRQRQRQTETDRDRERQRQRETERQRDRESF